MSTQETLTYRIKNQLLDFQDISDAEIEVLDGVVPGTVAANKAVVVDSNKDIGDFRNLDAVNIDAGASGTVGTVDVFPATAARGKLILTAANNTGNTNVTVQNAAHGQASVYSINDAGGATGYIPTTTVAAVGAGLERAANYHIPESQKVLFADSIGAIRHKVPMALDMAGAQMALIVNGAPGAGEALLTSDIVFANPNGAHVDLLLPPEGDWGGAVLFVHNVDPIYTITVKEDSDSAILGFLPPDVMGIFVCDGVDWQGGALKQNLSAATVLAPWEMRSHAGESLTAADTADTFHIGTGSVGGAGLVLLGEVSNGTVGADTETSAMTGRFCMPMNYVDGQSFSITLLACLKGSGAVTATPSIDLTAKVVASNGSLGADICATAALTLAAGAPAPKVFTITPATVAPATVIEFIVTTVVDNTDSVAVQSEITAVALVYTVSN